jgi:hypothetical protein
MMTAPSKQLPILRGTSKNHQALSRKSSDLILQCCSNHVSILSSRASGMWDHSVVTRSSLAAREVDGVSFRELISPSQRAPRSSLIIPCLSRPEHYPYVWPNVLNVYTQVVPGLPHLQYWSGSEYRARIRSQQVRVLTFALLVFT